MPSAEMPSTFRPTSPTLGKKRKREDGFTSSNEIQMKLSSSPHHAHDSIPMFQGVDLYTQDRYVDRERQYLLPRSHRRSHETKRQRVSLTSHSDDVLFADHVVGSPQDLKEGAKILLHTQGNTTPKKKIILVPCHICNRKPTQKNELDSYTDCEGCGLRTCWICLRGCATPWSDSDAELEGMIMEDGSFRKVDGGNETPWDKGRVEGHRAMICSRCCIERGPDGEVWCLGCLMAEKIGRERH